MRGSAWEAVIGRQLQNCQQCGLKRQSTLGDTNMPPPMASGEPFTKAKMPSSPGVQPKSFLNPRNGHWLILLARKAEI